MRKESGARYQSAGALAKDLQRWLDGRPIEARPATKLELALSWCRRNPAAAGLIATIALFLVAVAGGGGLLAAVEANARKKAEDLLTENRAMLSKSYVELRGPLPHARRLPRHAKCAQSAALAVCGDGSRRNKSPPPRREPSAAGVGPGRLPGRRETLVARRSSLHSRLLTQRRPLFHGRLGRHGSIVGCFDAPRPASRC